MELAPRNKLVQLEMRVAMQCVIGLAPGKPVAKSLAIVMVLLRRINVHVACFLMDHRFCHKLVAVFFQSNRKITSIFTENAEPL